MSYNKLKYQAKLEIATLSNTEKDLLGTYTICLACQETLKPIKDESLSIIIMFVA
jgi:hypothetical protein